MKTETQIEQYGWSLEQIQCAELVTGALTTSYRAFQGDFKTLWRDTPEQVLEDVKRIVHARESCTAPF